REGHQADRVVRVRAVPAVLARVCRRSLRLRTEHLERAARDQGRRGLPHLLHVGVLSLPCGLRAPVERCPPRKQRQFVHCRSQRRLRLSSHRALLGQSLIGAVMKLIPSTLIFVIIASLTTTVTDAAPKKVNVVTTLNILASVTRAIGGDRVNVTALAKP